MRKHQWLLLHIIITRTYVTLLTFLAPVQPLMQSAAWELRRCIDQHWAAGQDLPPNNNQPRYLVICSCFTGLFQISTPRWAWKRIFGGQFEQTYYRPDALSVVAVLKPTAWKPRRGTHSTFANQRKLSTGQVASSLVIYQQHIKYSNNYATQKAYDIMKIIYSIAHLGQ